MTNAKRLIVGLVVLVGGVMLVGCAEQYSPGLKTAIEDGNLNEIKSILEENPKLVNSVDSKVFYNNTRDYSPLSTAIVGGHKEAVKLLIERGANVNARNKAGDTPLCFVMCYTWYRGAERGMETTPNAEEMAMLLIENGANVKVGDLLLCAAHNGWYDLAELLIEKGVNVNAKSKTSFPVGSTALHYAVRFGLEEIAELLIENGANVNAKDKDGKTPLSLAINKDIADLLRKHGAVE